MKHKKILALLVFAVLLSVSVSVIIDNVHEEKKVLSDVELMEEDEEPELTPKQQLERKIKEVAIRINQRHENKMRRLLQEGESF